MKLILLFFAYATTTAANLSEESEAPETIWLQNENVLSCSPSTLRAGGKVILLLGPNHGKELMIFREADKTPFFLVVGSPPDDMRMPMAPEEFQKVKRLELPANVEGYAWVKDRTMELIFTVKGLYTVHTSEILESEIGGYKCTISFVP